MGYQEEATLLLSHQANINLQNKVLVGIVGGVEEGGRKEQYSGTVINKGSNPDLYIYYYTTPTPLRQLFPDLF
jgi:hypothetical protein